MWNPGGAWSSQEVPVPGDGLQVSLRAAHQDVRDQPGLPGGGQVLSSFLPFSHLSMEKLPARQFQQISLEVYKPNLQLWIQLLLSLAAKSYKTDWKRWEKQQSHDYIMKSVCVSTACIKVQTISFKKNEKNYLTRDAIVRETVGLWIVFLCFSASGYGFKVFIPTNWNEVCHWIVIKPG